MSEKLSRIRIAKVNGSTLFVAARKHFDGAAKTLPEMGREFERYEGLEVDEILPASLTDKFEGGKRTVGEILEEKEFELEDLPFSL